MKFSPLNQSRKIWRVTFLSAITAVGLTHAACATPQDKPAAQQPKTKIEAFGAQSGSVVITGFSKIGEVRGAYGGVASIESLEFTNASTGQKGYGISIDVTEAGQLDRSNRSFIDYDEIDSLVKGINYVLKTDKSVTKLDQFQADYRTKGDFRIGTFSSDKGTMASVESGSIGSTSILLKIDDLGKFRDFITSAKAKLDSIR